MDENLLIVRIQQDNAHETAWGLTFSNFHKINSLRSLPLIYFIYRTLKVNLWLVLVCLNLLRRLHPIGIAIDTCGSSEYMNEWNLKKRKNTERLVSCESHSYKQKLILGRAIPGTAGHFQAIINRINGQKLTNQRKKSTESCWC